MKKTFLSALLGFAAMTAAAQTWNFKTVSDEDVASMEADAATWYHEQTSSNNRFHLLPAISQAPLTAGEATLDCAQGLLFTANAASSNTSGNVRIDIKNKRAWVAGSSKVFIPNAKEGQTVTIVAMTSSSGTARGVNVSQNVTPVSGKFNETSTDQVTNVGTVNEAGTVELSFSGSMYVYEIALSEADDDEEDIVDDTPAPDNMDDHSTSANALKNQVHVKTELGTRYFNTDNVSSIDIADDKVTIVQGTNSYTYDKKVSGISFAKANGGNTGHVENSDGRVAITEAKGWFESAYVKFLPYGKAKTYNVYVKGGQMADYTKVDAQLVRNYGSYGRADVLGLIAGSDYAIKVTPVDSTGQEMTSAANEATDIVVTNYDRSGFAHKDRTEGVGAYNNDGSLKQGAMVVYVNKANAKTVSLDIASNNKGGTTTYTGFQQIIYGYQKGYETRPLDIRIVGTIAAADCDEFLSSAEGIQIKGKNAYSPMNITIEGVGDDAVTTGFGFLIRNAASIELRNFANMLCMDDAVSIDTDNQNIWIHNLDLFYGTPGSDADQVKGDGTIDMKADSKYVTIAYNHLWDSGKASLCGMKSETGPNWITYHHNWFDHSDSRHPRIRTMSVHVYNNYYDGNSKYGVGAAHQSNAFVERNYFRNCKYPMLISKQGSDVATNSKGTFSGEDGGMIKSFANRIIGATRYTTYQQNSTEFDAYEAQSREELVPESVAAKQGGRKYDNFDTDADLFYTYTPDEADDVPAIVTGWLGAGRMGHGDLQWTFNNATEDNNSDIIAELKKALQDYKTQLKGYFGEANNQGSDSEEPSDTTSADTTGTGTLVVVDNEVFCTFDKKGNPSSNYFAVVGNGSDSKGQATIDGVAYTTCLKMEKDTSVKFSLSKPMTMTLYFGDTETASIKIDGTKYTNTTSTLTQVLEAGAHELTKADSRNLFAIRLMATE